MNNKADLSIDEIYTYSLSNSKNGMYFFPTIFKESTAPDYINRWIEGQTFKDYLCASDDNRFNYSNVYENQLQDTHPPLYYYVIHTICSFFPNKFSKWYGLILNVLFFVATQILLIKLSKKILNSNKYALFTSIIFGFSCASINNFSYISTNAMLTVFYLLSLNFFIRHLEDNKLTKLRFIELLMLTVLGSLTHYLFLLYIIILSMTTIVIDLKKHNYKQGLFLFCTSIFAFLLIYLLSPEINEQINYSLYVQETILGVKNIIPNIGVYSYLIRKILGIPFPFYFYLGALGFICISCLILSEIIKSYFIKFNQNNLKLAIIPTFIIITLISLGINYNESEINPIKYLIAFFPIISIIIISILKRLNHKLITVFFIILSTISPLWGTNQILKDTEYKYSSINNLLRGNNVILFVSDKTNIQAFTPTLLQCNKILLSSNDLQNLNKILEESSKIDGKTYLLTDNNIKDNFIKYPKLKSGLISTYKVNVYEL